ncbi:hypothetical protein Afil01_35320 [Actinorhabdospora filicis]|uniref:Hemolysin type calcium-binding protein n=1 Tax=Actinorhabdospora filicis TaxID=1785913 RepID=A0A9W6WBH0_9ACTN|nr:M91 family zinc metallopeptidase [Actinorhabdospora filicis]GLZ78725.1 hypothetical protein Afil01_35320 [Actinorhabdospora filicis]
MTDLQKPINVDRTWWNLRADPGHLETVATAWETLGGSATRAATGLTAAAKRVVDGKWRGDARDGYASHVAKLTGSLDDVEPETKKVAKALRDTAGELRAVQGRLTQDESALMAAVPNTADATTIHFKPTTAEQTAQVTAAVATARREREALKGRLTGFAGELPAEGAWTDISKGWDALADGGPSPYPLPPEATRPGLTLDLPDGSHVVNGTTGDDKMSVGTDAHGNVVVTVNGVTTTYPPGTPITLRGGAGNDVIGVGGDAPATVLAGDGGDVIGIGAKGNHTVIGGNGDDTVTATTTATGNSYISTNSGNDTVTAGKGDDTIATGSGADRVRAGAGNDAVSGGAGDDYIDGQDGNDVLDGGAGDDIVYGLNGDDHADGGDGRDYVEGGKGSDVVNGGGGNDVVSGGQGDDQVGGGSGNDVLYAGRGSDDVDGGAGTDRAYVEKDDRMTPGVEKHQVVEIPDTSFIQIKGSPDFQERVRADLDLFASSPTGRKMIEELGRAVADSHGDRAVGEREIVINQTPDANGYANSWLMSMSDVNIDYNPEYTSNGSKPPSTVLYHELGHAYDFLKGTTEWGTYDGDDITDKGKVPSFERQAAGLPIVTDPPGDATPPSEGIDPDHPIEYTENGLRREFEHWGERQHYDD